ncbi:hypothetical protein Bca4012_103194 [Brassica carinata]
MCASQRVSKPVRRKEADWLILTVHSRPTLIFREGFECEHTCRDPKDGELCLSGRPEETLVEARSDTDANRSPDLGRTGGCFVEPSHGIESSKWAIFGKQNLAMRDEPKPGYGAQLRANLEPTKGVGRLRQQDGGHGSRTAKDLPTPETAQPEVGSSGWKSTARRVVSVHSRALENRGPKAATPVQPADCWRLLEPLTWRATASCRPGTDWERLFRAFRRRTANSELCSECQSEEIQPSAVNGGVTMTLLSQGNGLGRISGKEDPVELDSSPTL